MDKSVTSGIYNGLLRIIQELQADWIMKRKRYNRRKWIIIAYTLRAIVGFVLASMLILMICGVLFIYERMSGKVVFGKTVEVSLGENSLNNSN